MPLSEFFDDQFRQIKDFMLDPSDVVRIVRVDPDLKPVLVKAFTKLDDDPQNPHAMLYADVSFGTPGQYFADLLTQLTQDYEKNAKRLEAEGCHFDVPYDDRQETHAAKRFCMYASALADALPASLGSVAFVLDPDEVADSGAFRESIEYLSREVESTWLKFLVLDPRLEPRLDSLETEVERIDAQTFYMPPEEIEERLKESAQQQNGSDSADHRRTLGVLAGFAFSKKDYQEAARLQFEWAKSAEEADEPGEAASAYYNLGNTMVETGALDRAEQFLVRSCELCLEHSVNGVLPLALTNLGVTLFRQNRLDEAIESLRVAYSNFKAQKHRPGQAFVFDTLASAYYEQRRYDEAEEAWLAAFDIYSGITSDAFADLREAGRNDIEAKLTRFYAATGRPNRIDRQHEPAGAR